MVVIVRRPFQSVLALFAIASVRAIELVNLDCDPAIRETSSCGAGGLFNGVGNGPLTGTFICGKRALGFPGFSWQKETTHCVSTLLGQVVGYEGDTCGCCNNQCPGACNCVCDEEQDFVLVKKQSLLRGETAVCVSRGKASRWVSDGTTEYSCVSDQECPQYSDIPPADSEVPPADSEVPPSTEEEPPATENDPPEWPSNSDVEIEREEEVPDDAEEVVDLTFEQATAAPTEEDTVTDEKPAKGSAKGSPKGQPGA
ncbi:expressed unknown protein [Seminavis robusta]|uniref:Uncharacterized protein n=1 Tax=Seminavis robusta TaxID=568900 RepID=A0A9N8EBJ9_9STRA|nr:expressed unknown protein [Seminavis robusta]|eukprot:Sro906_g218660.1 n/a (256) ;mRNA; r:32469-33236